MLLLKRKNVFLILLLSATLACQKSDQADEKIMSRPEMVQALIEVHLLEARLSKLGVKKDSLMKIYNRFELAMFEDMGIEKDYYVRSFEYYMGQPYEMDAIYTIVVDSLNLREQKAEVIRDNQKAEDRRTKHSPNLKKKDNKSVPVGKPQKPEEN